MATSPTIATGVQDPNGGNEAESVPVYRSEPVVEHPSTEAISDKMTLSGVYATPGEWLIANRLQKFTESFEQIGCMVLSDLKEVLDDDLTEMGMPPLPQRRFKAAVANVPTLDRKPRAHLPASQLMRKVEDFTKLPNEPNDTSYDATMLADAAEQVMSAASNMQHLVLDPWQWLEDYGLALFKVNFEGLGVRSIVDFTEVLDQDLMAMAMPLLQFRRFREHAADIPPAGGSSYRLDLYAAEVAAKEDPAHQTAAWMKCLRLDHFQEKFVSIGVRCLKDFRELREDDLVAMAMPLLQRRRFLMSAAVAVPNLPDSAESALANYQHQSAMCNTPPKWLDALHLSEFSPNFDALGILDVLDFKEVMRSDLEEMELPLLQLRRFLASVAIIPEAQELPGRRWETPSKWLESVRLKRFEPYFVKLGVDRVVDFAEVTDTDLLEMSMSPIQRRRFRTAVAIDARPTLEADLVRAEDDALKSTVGMRAEDLLNLTPIRWLGLIRCENFIAEFEELGVEIPVDFAEVTEDDLTAMGLPHLQKRRFAQAAVQVEELHLFHQERVLANQEEEEEATLFSWLKSIRLSMFIDHFMSLGVEEIPDFAEVLSADLIDMGMKPLQRRRFQAAVTELSRIK